jgi:hypothetical protein
VFQCFDTSLWLGPLESGRTTSTDAGAAVRDETQEEKERRMVTLQVRGNGCTGVFR